MTNGAHDGATGLLDEPEDGGLEEVLASLAERDLAHAKSVEVLRAVEAMVTHVEYPCLGAKSVVRRGCVVHIVLDDLTAERTPVILLDYLRSFASGVAQTEGFHSFIVSFRGPQLDDEAAFETALFDLLQRLHDKDGAPWARGVEADPTDPHFAFSAGGTAYFIVGLHPAASRVARRAPLPTLVFNPHEQFEELRRDGHFEDMREVIRRRDEHVQGYVNPMAADHGESSEALQYSGRRHDSEWEPPLEIHLDEDHLGQHVGQHLGQHCDGHTTSRSNGHTERHG